MRLSASDGVIVEDCSWNPTVPGLVAISLSDGSLLTIELNKTEYTFNSLPPSTGAKSVILIICSSKDTFY